MPKGNLILHDSNTGERNIIKMNRDGDGDATFILPDYEGTLATMKSLEAFIPIETPSIIKPTTGEKDYSGAIVFSAYTPKSHFRGKLSHSIVELVKLTEEKLKAIRTDEQIEKEEKERERIEAQNQASSTTSTSTDTVEDNPVVEPQTVDAPVVDENPISPAALQRNTEEDASYHLAYNFVPENWSTEQLEILFKSPDFSINTKTTAVRIPKIEPKTTYLVRVVHVAENGLMSSYSPIVHFSTSIIQIPAPELEFRGDDVEKIEGEAVFQINGEFLVKGSNDTHLRTVVSVREGDVIIKEISLRPNKRDFRISSLKAATRYTIEVYYQGNILGAGDTATFTFTTTATKIVSIEDGVSELQGGNIVYGHYGVINVENSCVRNPLYSVGRWTNLVKNSVDNIINIKAGSLIQHQGDYFIFNPDDIPNIRALKTDNPAEQRDKYFQVTTQLIPTIKTVAMELGFHKQTNGCKLTDGNFDKETKGHPSITMRNGLPTSFIKTILKGRVSYITLNSLFDHISVNDLYRMNLIRGKRTIRLMQNLFALRIITLDEFKLLYNINLGELGKKVNFEERDNLQQPHLVYDKTNNRVILAKVLADGSIGISIVPTESARLRDKFNVKIAVEVCEDALDPSTPANVPLLSKGPKAENESLQYDATIDMGVFTPASSDQLPTVTNVLDALRVRTGERINTDVDYIKIYKQGEVYFVPNRPVLAGVCPNELAKLNALYLENTVKNAVIPIVKSGSTTYKICTMDASNSPIITRNDMNYKGASIYHILLRLSEETSSLANVVSAFNKSHGLQVSRNFTGSISNTVVFDTERQELTSTIANNNLAGGIYPEKCNYLTVGGNGSAFDTRVYSFVRNSDALVLNNNLVWRYVLKVLSPEEARAIEAQNAVISEAIAAETAKQEEINRIAQEQTQKHAEYAEALLTGKHATFEGNIFKPTILSPATDSTGYFNTLIWSKYIQGANFEGELTAIKLEVADDSAFTNKLVDETLETVDIQHFTIPDTVNNIKQPGKTFYARVKHVSSESESEWSDVVSWNTPNVAYGDIDIGLNDVKDITTNDGVTIEYMGRLPNSKIIRARRYRGEYQAVSMLSDISDRLDYRCHFYGMKIANDKYFEHPNGFKLPTFEEKDLRSNTKISYFQDDVVTYQGVAYYALKNVPPGLSPVHPEAAEYWAKDDRMGLPALDDLVLRQIKLPVGTSLQVNRDLINLLAPESNHGMFSNNVENITWVKVRIDNKNIFIPLGMPVNTISYQILADKWLVRRRRTIRIGNDLYYIRLLTVGEYKALLALANKEVDGLGIKAYGLNVPEWVDNPLDEADPLASNKATVFRTAMPGNSFTPKKVNIMRVEENKAGYRPVLEYIPPEKEPRLKAHLALAGLDKLPTITGKRFQYDFYTDTGNFGYIEGTEFASVQGVPNNVSKWMVNYYHGMILLQGINTGTHGLSNFKYTTHLENTTLAKEVTSKNIVTLSTGLRLLRFVGEIGVRKGDILTETEDNLHRPIVSTNIYDGIGSRDTLPTTLFDETYLRCMAGITTEYGHIGNPFSSNRLFTTALSTGKMQIGKNFLNFKEHDLIPSSTMTFSTGGVKANWLMGELQIGDMYVGDSKTNGGSNIQIDMFMQTPGLGSAYTTSLTSYYSINNSPSYFRTNYPYYVNVDDDTSVVYSGTKPTNNPPNILTRMDQEFKPNFIKNQGTKDAILADMFYQGTDFSSRTNGLGYTTGEVLEFSAPKPLQLGTAIGWTATNNSMFSMNYSGANNGLAAYLKNSSMLRYTAYFKPHITGRTQATASSTANGYFQTKEATGGWMWETRDTSVDKGRSEDNYKVSNFRSNHTLSQVTSYEGRHKNQMHQATLMHKDDIITQKYLKAYENIVDDQTRRIPMRTNIALLTNFAEDVTTVVDRRATFILDYTQTAYAGAKLPNRIMELQALPAQSQHSTTSNRKIPEAVYTGRGDSWDIPVNIQFKYPSFEFNGVVGTGYVLGINGYYVGNGLNFVESYVGSSGRVRLYGIAEQDHHEWVELGYALPSGETIPNIQGELYRAENGVVKHIYENNMHIYHGEHNGRLMAPKTTRLMSRLENFELGSVMNRQFRTFMTQHNGTKVKGSASPNGKLDSDVVIADNAIVVNFLDREEYIEGYVFSSSYALKKHAGYTSYFFNLLLPVDVVDES